MITTLPAIRFIRRMLQPTRGKRIVFFLLVDAWIVTVALAAAFLIRFDFMPEPPYARLVLPALPLFLFAQLGALALFGGYAMSWRFVSLRDLANILNAVIAASLALAFALYFLRLDSFVGFPRGVLLIDAVLVFILVAALRIGKRAAMEVLRGQRHTGRGKRTIIIGAGNTGEMVLRDMQRTQYDVYAPVAFLDDDERLLGTRLHGVRVRGAIRHLADTIRSLRVETVIVAIQSLGHQDLRRIYRAAKEAGIADVKIVPRLYDVHAPQIRLQAIEEIKIEDLIRREVVRVDTVAIRRVLAGKTVLVTGAAGSIGSEIVRQSCRYGPRSLVCFEIDETELHHLQLTLRREFPALVDRVRYVVGDIRDTDRVDEVFERCRPDVVFHAAAYKHVPMMEGNASEAVKVNVVGTWNIAEAARRVGTGKFVLISTDKAVRPTSVMGATKRIAEQLCRACGSESQTAFLSVRFGNVLGSRGSVLPIFLEQLARGGPLTVTHEEMRRYFMTIPEAVALVLQAGAIGRSGEVLVFDMGDPVHIRSFAEELIRLHNLRPHTDIAIEYIGIRPGEKLFEELLTAEEGTTATAHEKLWVARSHEVTTREEMQVLVQQLHQLARFPDTDGSAIRQLLRQRIAWYEPGVTAPPRAAVAVGAPVTPDRARERTRELA